MVVLVHVGWGGTTTDTINELNSALASASSYVIVGDSTETSTVGSRNPYEIDRRWIEAIQEAENWEEIVKRREEEERQKLLALRFFWWKATILTHNNLVKNYKMKVTSLIKNKRKTNRENIGCKNYSIRF